MFAGGRRRRRVVFKERKKVVCGTDRKIDMVGRGYARIVDERAAPFETIRRDTCLHPHAGHAQ